MRYESDSEEATSPAPEAVPAVQPAALPHVDRRRFLRSSLAVGVTALAPANAAHAQGQAAAPLTGNTELCGLRPSIVDALDAYETLLLKLQAEALRGIIRNLMAVTRECSETLKLLQAELIKLQPALEKARQARGSARGDVVRPALDTVEASFVHARQLEESIAGGGRIDHASSLLVVLTATRGEVGGMVSDLLRPAGVGGADSLLQDLPNIQLPRGVVLSDEVINILDEILRLIRSSRALEQQLRTVRDDVRPTETKLNNSLTLLRGLLDEARKNALVVENPHVTDAGDRKDARSMGGASIKRAIETAESLRSFSGTDNQVSILVDLLVTLLEGTALLLEGHTAESKAGDLQTRAHNGAIFLSVAARSTPVIPPPVPFRTISDLFWCYCPPGSSPKVVVFDSIILSPLEAVARSSYLIGRPMTVDYLSGKILTSLLTFGFKCAQDRQCDRNIDRSQHLPVLAKAIASRIRGAVR